MNLLTYMLCKITIPEVKVNQYRLILRLLLEKCKCKHLYLF